MGGRVPLILLLAASCIKAPVEPVSTPAPLSTPEPLSPPMRAEALSTPVAQAEACPHGVGDDAILLDFDAFGPSAMSSPLLGQAWWQWDGEGHTFEEQGGTVWVVVHDDAPPDELAVRFPVRQAERCDHRYVDLDDALAYLEDHIAELDGLGDDANAFGPLIERLRTTREELLRHFRSPRSP